MGQVHYSKALDIFSPNNSSDGNLRKKWKIINRNCYLIKGGNSFNNQEPFNELITTRLYERILSEGEFVSYQLIEEDVEDILRKNPLMDEERIKAITQQVKIRISKVKQRKEQLRT